jgi:hypothetical protein
MLGGVVAHLAFDGPGVGASATRLAAAFEDLRQEKLMVQRVLLRGEKNRR